MLSPSGTLMYLILATSAKIDLSGKGLMELDLDSVQKNVALEGKINSLNFSFFPTNINEVPFFSDSGWMGKLNFQYQGGNTRERVAKVTSDPIFPEKRALKLTLYEPNCCEEQRGRIQLNAYDMAPQKNLIFFSSFMLPKEMENISHFPGKMNFLTISEWWNNPGWSGEYPFRISVNIVKESESIGADLVLEVRAQIKQEDKIQQWQGSIWEETNYEFKIPYGQWVDFTYHFVNGDSEMGKFSLIADVGTKRYNIFEINNWTHHPNDPLNKGLSSFNPVKWYTSYQLINFMNMESTPLTAYWNNLVVYSY